MNIQPIKTRKFLPPKDEILSEIANTLSELPERSILVITSKIVSIEQGRCIPVEGVDKDVLAMNESELFLSREEVPERYALHTITDGILIASAGIDASNANEHFILWPNDIDATLKRYHEFFTEKFSTKEFGIMLVDSRSVPLKRGVVGIAIGSIGFKKLVDYRESNDIFGKELKCSQVNVPDSLAAAAVVTMGEGDEQTPCALITNTPFVVFGGDKSLKTHSTYKVPLEEDIYKPFLDIKWQKGGKGAKT